MRYSIIFVMLAIPTIAQAATLKVPSQYPTIQNAIDSALNGDTVLVEPGTYAENINFKGKAITVKGEQGPDVTVIDGSQRKSIVTFWCGEGQDSVLDGFTITNGTGTYYSYKSPNLWWIAGGGILCHNSSPVLHGNIISVNSAECGGGIYCLNSSPIIENNTILKNTVTLYHGGGIYCYHYSSPTIMKNTIIGNYTGLHHGGGIYCDYYSSPTITDNTISGNTASMNGGGIGCKLYYSPTIVNNAITDNTAGGSGCGINCDYSSPTITNNTITGNSSKLSAGGGIYCYKSFPDITNNTIAGCTAWSGGGIFCLFSSPAITNNIISGNKAEGYGGGIGCYNSDSLTIANNTITGNKAISAGGGIYYASYSSSAITNTILWDNNSRDGAEVWIGKKSNPSTLTISYSDVKGGKSSVYVDFGCTLNLGPGMIDSDPLFVDSSNDDFHLTFTSPCKDTGDNTEVLDIYDFEGDPRIAYGTVDMGADEFYTHLYWTGDATRLVGMVKLSSWGCREPRLSVSVSALVSSIHPSPQSGETGIFSFQSSGRLTWGRYRLLMVC